MTLHERKLYIVALNLEQLSSDYPEQLNSILISVIIFLKQHRIQDAPTKKFLKSRTKTNLFPNLGRRQKKRSSLPIDFRFSYFRPKINVFT